ncbi:MAG: DUF4349 domain-containing protein [Clostridia bacterium]|nr:DUF4349 domain-containing protein [Clostridia bacterium]
MTNCENYERLLIKYECGEADETELSEMAEHEKHCEDCAAKRKASDDVLQRLIDLRSDVPEIPLDFHDKWMKKISSERKSMIVKWARIAGAIAACLLVFAVVINLRGQLKHKMQAMQAYEFDDAFEEVSYAAPYAASGATYNSYASSSTSYDAMVDSESGLFLSARSSSSTEEAASVSEETIERLIIRTASLDIATTTFDDSLNMLTNLCEQNQGWVSESSISTGNNGLKRANITMRIPSQNLNTFLNGTAEIGRITSRNETAEDVTESYADTKSRLNTQKLLLERLQSLVGTANELEDLLKLERQIADTQYNIDSLTSSLLHTDRQVRDSAVSITLREEKPKEVVVTKNISFAERIAAAFSMGMEAFINWLQDLVLTVMAALPFLALTAVAALVIWRVIHHIRHRKH